MAVLSLFALTAVDLRADLLLRRKTLLREDEARRLGEGNIREKRNCAS